MTSPERPSKTTKAEKNEEMMTLIIPRKLMKRPFPLIWGVVALGLFACFAVVTQLQFNRLNDAKIEAARMDTYNSDVRAYEVGVKSNNDCIASITTRETYRSIFSGIELMFEKIGELPASLFPGSDKAAFYQQTMEADIQSLIHDPVDQGLPPKKASDCPPVPAVPERP